MRKVHPLPTMGDTLAQLTGAQMFSKLNGNSGFWPIPLSSSSKLLTTFLTHNGLYCFNKLLKCPWARFLLTSLESYVTWMMSLSLGQTKLSTMPSWSKCFTESTTTNVSLGSPPSSFWDMSLMVMEYALTLIKHQLLLTWNPQATFLNWDASWVWSTNLEILPQFGGITVETEFMDTEPCSRPMLRQR